MSATIRDLGQAFQATCGELLRLQQETEDVLQEVKSNSIWHLESECDETIQKFRAFSSLVGGRGEVSVELAIQKSQEFIHRTCEISASMMRLFEDFLQTLPQSGVLPRELLVKAAQMQWQCTKIQDVTEKLFKCGKDLVMLGGPIIVAFGLRRAFGV